MIFDHIVRLEDIRANLATELNTLLGAFNFIDLFLFFLFEVLIDPRRQPLERRGFVFKLRTLVLILHHDTGGYVGNAYG